MRKSGARIVDRAINTLLMFAVAVVLALPGSPLRRIVDGWLDERRNQRLVAAHWSGLLADMIDTASYRGEDIVVAFVDYQCSACATANADLASARERGIKVAVVQRHFPLVQIHPNAEGAARSAICAERQGILQEMNAILYGTTDWHESAAWLRLAEEAGVPSLSAFENCLTDDATSERLREDRYWAEMLEVRATPTFVFHDGKEIGYYPQGRWQRLVGQGSYEIRD